MTTPARDTGAEGFRLKLSPPPLADPKFEERYGLKLDWRSEVGRTGMLLEWQPVGRGVDAGVPVPVARALADGLSAAATVAGCTLEVPDAVGPGWAAVPGGHACRLPRQWWQRPRFVGLLASQTPDVVEGMFEDSTFPWALEQQVLFLSQPGVLPRLDAPLVEACFSVPMRAGLARLAAAGVVGLLVAGVDGDVAGLYALAPGWRALILAALAQAAEDAGGRWEAHGASSHGETRTAGVSPTDRPC